MGKWVMLNLGRLDPPQKQTIHGADVIVFHSPHDLPEAIRCLFDSSQKTLKVNLKYMADEPTTEQLEGSGDVTWLLGRHSRRLYGAEIRSSDKYQELWEKFKEALMRDSTERLSIPNYHVVTKAVEQKENELMETLDQEESLL